MLVVLLSFDSLAVHSLGCYGNEWVETPHLDQLAATGIVFDQCVADRICSRAGQSWTDPASEGRDGAHHRSVPLADLLAARKIETKLITVGTPRPWMVEGNFQSVVCIAESDPQTSNPSDVSIARLIQSGCDYLKSLTVHDSNQLLWLHCSKPGLPPVGFDSLYFEDFEERGQKLTDLPTEDLAQHPATYAGSVSLIDHWIGELSSAIKSARSDSPTMVVVTAAEGHVFHEFTREKTSSDSRRPDLNDQQCRVPLIISTYHDDRWRDWSGVRCDRLVSSSDLSATLQDYFAFGSDESGNRSGWLQEATEAVAERPAVLIEGDGSVAVRTKDWLCVREPAEQKSFDLEANQSSEFRYSLYVKPDDLWDVNNLSAQEPAVIDQLSKWFPSSQKSNSGLAGSAG